MPPLTSQGPPLPSGAAPSAKSSQPPWHFGFQMW